MDLTDLEECIGYAFTNKDLLIRALTHSSYANESNKEHGPNNERLEFLGDAVLETVISEYLYKNYPDMPEGELTGLRASVVCESVLVKKSVELSIGEYLFLGKGEERTGGRRRNSILADAFEAIAGAVFIDGGYARAKKFLIAHLSGEIVVKRGVYKIDDHKSYLQELIQKNDAANVRYQIVNESGPDHEKVFTARAVYRDRVIGEGTGRTKKEAEQCAARIALSEFAP